MRYLQQLPKLLKRETANGQYLPLVDGLRFLAILPVIVQHTSERLIKHGTVEFAAPVEQDQLAFLASRGTIGVFLFFAISGFMLSLPFAKHHLEGTKSPSLKHYFTRRFTRIEPPYLVWMTVFALVLLAQGAWAVGDLLPHWLASCFYLHTLLYGDYSVINPVAWSLEIEIQFYLIAPWLVGLFFSIKNAQQRQWILLASIFGFIALQHLLGWQHSPFKPTLLGQLQHFLVGIWLADSYLARWSKSPAAHWKWDLVVLPAAFVMAYTWTEEFAKSWVFALSMLLLFVAGFRSQFFQRFLNNRWVAIIGGMCYTIYLTHLPLLELQMLFTKHLTLTNHYLPNLLLQLAIGLPVILGAAAIFYLLLEKPFMKKTLPNFGWAFAAAKSFFAKQMMVRKALIANPAIENSKKLVVVVAMIFLGGRVAAQDSLTAAYQLPPLDTLVKIALEKSPELRSQDVWIEIQSQEWKLQKKTWMNLVSVGAATNIGTNNVLDYQQTTSSAEYIAVNRQSAVYNAGIAVRISLGDVLTRSDKNNIARLEWERAQTDRLILEDKIREGVIAYYDNLQAALRLLVLEAQSVETQRLAFEVADKYFREGTMKVEDYSSMLSKLHSAEKLLLSSQIEAQKAYRQLREFVGI